MPTFSPFSFLLIFLGIQLAPQSATQITIQMDQYNRIILERQGSSEWKRIDNDVVIPVSFTVEQTKVIAKGEDRKTESIDLIEHYKITGKENWKDVKEILTKEQQLVKLIYQDNKLIVESNSQGQKIVTEITWILKKNKE